MNRLISRFLLLALCARPLSARAGVVRIAVLEPGLTTTASAPALLPSVLPAPSLGVWTPLTPSVSLTPAPALQSVIVAAPAVLQPIALLVAPVLPVLPIALKPAPLMTAAPARDDAPTQKVIAASLKAANNEKLGEFFDGDSGKLKGTWKGDPETTADQPAVLSEGLASDLRHVSLLKPEKFRKLMHRLAKNPPRVRGPPAFDEDYTFSYELEFLVNKQIGRMDLDQLFKGKKALDEDERGDWERNRSLSEDRWEKVWRKVVSGVRAAMPKGWRIIADGVTRAGPNTLELNTGNAQGGRYHRNTPQDWADFTATLERVQEALPGGLYSVHMHTSKDSLRDGGALKVDKGAFGRVVKVFEAQWRALAGLGWNAFVGDAVTALPYEALRPQKASRYVTDHSNMINLSDRFPTMENRTLTGLLEGGYKGAFLNPERMTAEAWWSFALLRAAARGDMPLAALGTPTSAGEKPGDARLAAFLDLVYGDDVVGKALAMARFGSLEGNGPSLSKTEMANEKSAARAQYDAMGLAVVFDLHDRAGGYDASWRETLKQPELHKALLADLLARGSFHLSAYFPADMAEGLARELPAFKAEQEAAARAARRAWFKRTWVYRAWRWLTRWAAPYSEDATQS